ncbi:sulfatase [uncultured Polaribacter sp.]|uniref:sulfatase n=1 Tax=uncultured Polaribacter sp. TaxID=174711 RepID=UPI002614B900|nr:sulfatase [uncultured Polaribacter sp.]
MKYILNKPALVLLLFVFSLNFKAQEKKDLIKPNVIIFYVDDLGWQDTEINNLDDPSPWETPNIAKLAKDAVNFTNGYSPAPTCAPSRCAMLTGLHPTKTGVTHVAGGILPKASGRSTYIHPFFPEGLEPEHFTMAEALKMNGYKTGHVGKWHVGHLEAQKSINQGFDFAFESRGAHQGPKKPDNRLTAFATHNENDKYRLSDEKYAPFTKESPQGISYPKDEVTEKALKFIKDSKEEPFFLYLAHWLVHAPIHTKNKELLQYYSDKLGIDFPTKNIPIKTGGQTNPFYGSMVTTLDWSLGRVVDLLKKTDDPRNPGKKLYETTYIIFSSDNGAVEKANGDIVTDNFPLDQGKKYAQEGGIRVPLLISGPSITKGKTYDGLVNQLDFFPTILDLTGSKVPTKYSSDFDGLNITGVLQNNEKDIKNDNGEIREELWWHFPHNQDSQMQSAIRSGDYKLYKNHIKGNYELYRLYKNGERADLEEKHDIAKKSPEIVKDLATKLEKYLKDYDAKFPYKDPSKTKGEAENVATIPKVMSDSFNKENRQFTVKLEKGKSKVIEAYALVSFQNLNSVSKNGKKRKIKAPYVSVAVDVNKNNLEYTLTVPKGATECAIVFIDENRFMVKSKFHQLAENKSTTKKKNKKNRKKKRTKKN